MLASEPPARLYAGGGISLRVNGTTIENGVNLQSDSTEQRSGNVDNVPFNSGDSKTLIENKATSWSNATITWRGEAQHSHHGSCNSDLPNSDAGKTCIVTSQTEISAQPFHDGKTTSAGQLVHVIRVQSTAPNLKDLDASTDSGLDMARINHTTKCSPLNKTSPTIRITARSNNSCHEVVGINSENNVEFRNEKVSVVVGTPINHLMKGEDERSSSGASSAPGSDCERSDSDREGDDGTDSGFSSSRRHCARIIVTTKNSNNMANNFISLNSYSPDQNGFVGEINKVPVVCNEKGNVKLTISSYTDKDMSNMSSVCPNDDGAWDMHFHVNELENAPKDKKQDSEDVQTKIATAHALLSGQGDMFSLRNRVRSSIVSLLVQSATNRNYDQEEVGRVVFYTTSMGVVRSTFERCRKVRKILETLMVKFEERDVFMNRGFQQEIRERLSATRVIVPQVFIEGRHLGGAEILEQLNEIGHLRDFLRPYKRQSVGGTCQQCGGYRYLLCPICGGSKKSTTHRHHFSEDLVALRCVTCDESGLIRCPQCINGEG